MAAAKRDRPHICLIDVAMPGNGILAAARIVAELPAVAVVRVRNEDDELDPALDPSGNVVYLDGPTYTGHYTAWGGGNFNGGGTSGFTFTFSVHGVGSDGSTFREPDIVKVIFERDVCH